MIVGTASMMVRKGTRRGSGDKGHVLVVEDDDVVRDLIADALKNEGCDVDVAADAQDALAAAGARQPDVIVLGLNLPYVEGLRFARSYRSRALNPAPVVVISALPGSVTDLAAPETGASAVLYKPFDLDQLLVLVRRYTHRATAA